jgi:hypothetical protein
LIALPIMQAAEDLIAEDRPVATYAQPLSRLQVSWGSVLAGALAFTAVSFIVWALCLAIILSATTATVSAAKAAVIAGWVTAIITTLLGAFVGGMVAGYLPGNPRRAVALLHGFLAWCVAFVVSVMIHGTVISGATRAVTQAVTATTSAAVQGAGAAVGGAAGAPAALDQRAASLLQSLGYTPAEANSMVSSARDSLQQILRGQGPQAAQVQQGAQQAATQARGALDTLIHWAAAYTWLWWATWMVSGGLAAAGATTVLQRTRRVAERERESGAEALHVTTLRPARTVS